MLLLTLLRECTIIYGNYNNILYIKYTNNRSRPKHVCAQYIRYKYVIINMYKCTYTYICNNTIATCKVTSTSYYLLPDLQVDISCACVDCIILLRNRSYTT